MEQTDNTPMGRYSGKSVTLPNKVIFEFVENMIGSGSPVTIPMKGHSMEPLLQEGKCHVTLAPLSREPQPADVILFRIKDRHILHRLISIEDDIYLFQGDNVEHNGEMARRRDIVAILEKVTYDDGTVLRCDSDEWKEKTNEIWKPKFERLNRERKKDSSYVMDCFNIETIVELDLFGDGYDYVIAYIYRPSADNYWASMKDLSSAGGNTEDVDISVLAFHEKIPQECRFSTREEALAAIPDEAFSKGWLTGCIFEMQKAIRESKREAPIKALEKLIESVANQKKDNLPGSMVDK